MPLTNTQMLYYDSNVLRLPADKRKEYHAQVDRLIDELRRSLKDHDDELKVTKVVKAGSFAKYTILRKTSSDAVDVDVVFYISGKDASHESLSSLSETIHKLLIDIYPTKSVEHFEIQRRAATVTFVGSGISVDIVPVVQDSSRADYGWQFDIKDGSKNETCAPCQLLFVRDRKSKDTHFRSLVRLGKRWKNQSEVDGLKSFHVELIMAHLIEKNGIADSIEKRFRDFLLYIAQSGLKERIEFSENQSKPAVAFTTPVVIVDPVNNSNNVAARITEDERKKIVQAAQKAWEDAVFASEENDMKVWKEIFGPRFKVEDDQ